MSKNKNHQLFLPKNYTRISLYLSNIPRNSGKMDPNAFNLGISDLSNIPRNSGKMGSHDSAVKVPIILYRILYSS
jgi:hypothetical protein